jgi:hypothetical protein
VNAPTTLNTAPVAPLLERLFDEAAAASPAASAALAAMSAPERARLMHSKTEYLDFYARLKDVPLPVSRETGTLLYMLARSSGAQQRREKHRRVRHLVRHFNAVPGRGAARQRRRPCRHHRVRALQGGARPRPP